MTIDYDRLAELLDTATPGPWRAIPNYNDGQPRPDDSCLIKVGDEYLGIMHGPDADLTALAPDMARELLRLRAGLVDLITQKELLAAKLCDPHTELLNPDWLLEVGGEEPIGMALQKVCDQLTELLKGHEA